MENENVKNAIANIVSQIIQCDATEIREESGYLKTFGWDSFAQVMIISNIEDEFKISIPDDRIIELSTIRALIEYIVDQ